MVCCSPQCRIITTEKFLHCDWSDELNVIISQISQTTRLGRRGEGGKPCGREVNPSQRGGGIYLGKVYAENSKIDKKRMVHLTALTPIHKQSSNEMQLDPGIPCCAPNASSSRVTSIYLYKNTEILRFLCHDVSVEKAFDSIVVILIVF